jgi:hypothetical protein
LLEPFRSYDLWSNSDFLISKQVNKTLLCLLVTCWPQNYTCLLACLFIACKDSVKFESSSIENLP